MAEWLQKPLDTNHWILMLRRVRKVSARRAVFLCAKPCRVMRYGQTRWHPRYLWYPVRCTWNHRACMHACIWVSQHILYRPLLLLSSFNLLFSRVLVRACQRGGWPRVPPSLSPWKACWWCMYDEVDAGDIVFVEECDKEHWGEIDD